MHFTKYIENEEEPPVMSTVENPHANPVTPDKDATMNDVSGIPIMTEEEENALLVEFDPSTQEPPPKQHKPSDDPLSESPLVHPTTPTPVPGLSPQDSLAAISSASAIPESHGTNIGMFTSVQQPVQSTLTDVTKAPSILDQNTISNKIAVNHIVKNFIKCRFKLDIKGKSYNLPHMVKQVTKLFRSVDPSLHILPFNDSLTNNNVLDTEENLPHDEDSIKTWVVQSFVQKDKLHF